VIIVSMRRGLRPLSSLLVLALLSASLALAFPERLHVRKTANARVVGVQPRGNAILRSARSSPGAPRRLASPEETTRLREEAMEHLGLNLNNYWTLRSGMIADSIPTPELSNEAQGERASREAAAERAEQRLQKAERRLLERVRSPESAPRLCAALHEARRLGCRDAKLIAKAAALLSILERAARAADDATRRADPEDARREALVHQLALAIEGDADI
jgi:hypothetical protein